MRKNKEDTEKSRRMILDSAYKVFLKNGYVATKMSDIADEISMTRGVIYWHFKNKMELFICLLNELIDESFSNAQLIFQSEEPLREKLRRMLRKDECGSRLVELLKTFHPEVMNIDSKTRETAIKMIMKKVHAGFNALTLFLANEQVAGKIRKDVDIQAFSMTFMLVANILHAHEQHDSKMSIITVLNVKYDQILDILWNGLDSIFVDESEK